ncbi:MAG: MerR family transcriptional regulator [Cytophagales bacterium]|nr:MAG: MerR family transcriptional regulator [Cytophagales bacterium]
MDAKYSIKDLERFSGIKAHTIRIWEQRYKILKPTRTNNNIRFYSNDDLKLILNLSVLNTNGYKISQLANLSEEEINDTVKKVVAKKFAQQEQLNALTISMIDLDEERFNEIIENNIAHSGFKDTIENTIFPFLRQTGFMWQTGTIFPAQEHFLSNLIRQKLISKIASYNFRTSEKSKKFLLFLPEKELHEISLLYFQYLVLSNGHQCIYLGQSVPFEDLLKVLQIKKPYGIITIFTQPFEDNLLQDYIDSLAKECKDYRIIVSGFQIFTQSKLILSPNIEAIKNSQDLENLLTQIS